MKTGFSISCAKIATVHSVLIFPFFPACFPGLAPILYTFRTEINDNQRHRRWSGVFPPCTALRVMRRSDPKGNTGLFRLVLSGKEVPTEEKTRL